MNTKDHSFRIKGGRIGVLLIHGLAGTPIEMRYVASGLAHAGYTVHCPQLAGHCGTEEDLKASTWQDWYKSCEDALDELRQECDFVIAGGLSTGAVLGLMLAAKRPGDVQATALYAPTLWLNGWLIPWYARLFNTVFNKRVANLIKFPDMHPHGIKDPRIREFVRSALFSDDSSQAGLPNTPGGAVLEHRWLVNALMPLLKDIAQPALIMHPREDDYAALDNAWHLQKTLKGKVEMTVLEDSYHIITIDRQRHIVVEQTAAFIANTAMQHAESAAKAQFRAKVQGGQTTGGLVAVA